MIIREENLDGATGEITVIEHEVPDAPAAELPPPDPVQVLAGLGSALSTLTSTSTASDVRKALIAVRAHITAAIPTET